CFELATQIMARLGPAISPVDEVHGFRYFDSRDLIGFVDGTENPKGQDAADATLIANEDPTFAGGSYVIVQKYLHDLAGWNALPTQTQERIIGRTKLSNVELDDAVKPPPAHAALTVIEEKGAEVTTLREHIALSQAGSAAGRRFARHRLPQRRSTAMNNLHRELAPISAAAWTQLEEEATRTLKRSLAGRRVVDLQGPGGPTLAAVGTGHTLDIAAPGE